MEQNPISFNELQKQNQQYLLSFQEFKKVQEVVLFIQKNNGSGIPKLNDRIEHLRFVFINEMSKVFSDGRWVLLQSTKPVNDIIYVYKISKDRPEVYLIINQETGDYSILDQRFMDVYKTFEKPNWSFLWGL